MSAARLLASSLFVCLFIASLVMAEDEKVRLCANKLASFFGQLPCVAEDVAAAKATAMDTSAGLTKCCAAPGCTKYYLLQLKCE